MDVSIKIFLCDSLLNEGSYCILQGTRKSCIATFTFSLDAHDKLSMNDHAQSYARNW